MQPDLDRLLREAREALAAPDDEREQRAVDRALAGRRVRPAWRVALVAALALVALSLSLGAVAAVVVPDRKPASAGQTAQAARVIDRTFSCLPALAYDGAGNREFGLAVTKRARYSTPVERWEPASLVLDGGSPVSRRSRFVIVRGHESRSALAAPGLNGPGFGGVYVNRRSCVPSRKAVPLSQRGLPGPAVRYETGTGCAVRGRILVRVRATLVAPARWRELDELFSGAQRNVSEMAVAIRAERTNRPLLFARAQATSTVLWRADSCR